MKKKIVCLVIASFFASSRASPQERQEVPEGTVIKSEVNLVNLEVVVENKGKPVAGLKPENFRVEICVDEPESKTANKNTPQEKCEFQKISFSEETSLPPAEITILVDVSASGKDYFESFTKKAVPELIRQVGRTRDKFKLFEFSQSINWLGDIEITKTSEVNSAAERARQILADRKADAHGSDIFGAIFSAAKDPQYGLVTTKGNVSKIMVLVTDGFAFSFAPLIDRNTGGLCPEERRIFMKITGCRETRKEDVIRALEEEGVALYVLDFSKDMFLPQVVSFRPVNAPSDLGEIAEKSGGRRILVASVKEAQKAFEKISEAIKRMYVLGFYPTLTEKRWYERRVEVGYLDKNGRFRSYNYDLFYRKNYILR